jgi:hypothetical protein
MLSFETPSHVDKNDRICLSQLETSQLAQSIRISTKSISTLITHDQSTAELDTFKSCCNFLLLLTWPLSTYSVSPSLKITRIILGLTQSAGIDEGRQHVNMACLKLQVGLVLTNT